MPDVFVFAFAIVIIVIVLIFPIKEMPRLQLIYLKLRLIFFYSYHELFIQKSRFLGKIVPLFKALE